MVHDPSLKSTNSRPFRGALIFLLIDPCLDMVEVGGSNPPGPTNFLSRCFYSILFFQNRAFWRFSERGHYRAKVVSNLSSISYGYRRTGALPSEGIDRPRPYLTKAVIRRLTF